MARSRKDKRSSGQEKTKAIARVFKLIEQSKKERGSRGERTALHILAQLRSEDFLEEFWFIPQKTFLDKLGIDFICKRGGAYYFINVKSSWTGVQNFLWRKITIKANLPKNSYDIYPLLVRSSEKQELTRNRLLSEVFSRPASCRVLPKKIKRALSVLYAPTENREEIGPADDSSFQTVLNSSHSPKQKIKNLVTCGYCRNLEIISNPVKREKGKRSKTMWQAEGRVFFRGTLLEAVREKYTKETAEYFVASDLIIQIIRKACSSS